MNARQKIAVGLGVLVFAVMGLFPPWTHIGIVYRGLLPPQTIQLPVGYAFIGAGVPVPQGFGWSAAIDMTRLLIQWAVVLVLTSAGVLVLSGERREESVSDVLEPLFSRMEWISAQPQRFADYIQSSRTVGFGFAAVLWLIVFIILYFVSE